MDTTNNHSNDMNNNVNPTLENNGITENKIDMNTEEAATVFDAEPIQEAENIANAEEPQATQSNFAAFDSQTSINPNYSAYVAAGAAAPQSAPVKTTDEYAASKSKATVAMVLGIISIVASCLCCCLPVSIVLAIISFVLAFKSKKLAPDKKLNGMAIAAIICSSAGLFLYLISLFFGFFVGLAMITDPEIQADINHILAQYGYEIVF